MAAKKIYVTHDFQTGANVKGMKLENDLPSAVAGGVAYDGAFKVNADGSNWESVTTADNTQTVDNKNLDCGTYAGGG